MKTRRPRCILFDGHLRCRRPAAQRMGDLFTCCRHGRITLLVMADWCSSESRRMLAYARWETPREGQKLIDEMHRRAAA